MPPESTRRRFQWPRERSQRAEGRRSSHGWERSEARPHYTHDLTARRARKPTGGHRWLGGRPMAEKRT
jgi:hypothetical protein